MLKVLLTGFEPFGKVSQNPSAEIVLAINEAGIPATVSLSAGCYV